jgi:beta-glucanase (GH16 family)
MFVDDDEYYVIELNSSLPFDNDFFLIFNVALGGSLGGTIDPAFTSDTMEIDYVRVYQ